MENKSIIIAESNGSFYVGNTFQVEERLKYVKYLQDKEFKIIYQHDNVPLHYARTIKKLIWKQLSGNEVNTWRFDTIGFTKIKCVFHKNRETYKIVESIIRTLSTELSNKI